MPSRDHEKPSKAKVYSDDFKRSAVQFVTEQKYSITAAARAVGVSEPSPGATLEELREENKRLKRALKRAELEREILNKATAFFAQESQ